MDESVNKRDALQQQVWHVLQEQYAEWRVQAIQVAGTGLESCVFRVETENAGTLAIRVPWDRTVQNENDGIVDGRRILKKEQMLSQVMQEHGILVPKPLVLHLSAELDFLATEFVEHDGSESDPVALGQMIKRMHEVPPPDTGDVHIWRGTSLHAHLCERLERRTDVVARETGQVFQLPSRQAMQDVLAEAATTERVLHMDLRPSNLLTRGGKLAGIIDWSNSMFGHPALDLARMDECGHLTGALLTGYGESPFASISTCAELLYRLDTATMLAVVFLSEAPDPQLANRQLDRMKELHALLREEW